MTLPHTAAAVIVLPCTILVTLGSTAVLMSIPPWLTHSACPIHQSAQLSVLAPVFIDMSTCLKALSLCRSVSPPCIYEAHLVERAEPQVLDAGAVGSSDHVIELLPHVVQVRAPGQILPTCVWSSREWTSSEQRWGYVCARGDANRADTLFFPNEGGLRGWLKETIKVMIS